MTDLAMARVERAVSVAQRRAERIRVGMHSFIATRKEIAAAYADRDWFTLGYGSFEAYVESEFSEVRLRLSPEERREAVAELRLTGMSQRGIAATLGVSQSTVRDDVGELSTSTQFPDRVASADGKDRPATRPAATFREQREAFEQDPQTPGPASASTSAVAGPGSTPPEPGPPTKPDPVSAVSAALDKHVPDIDAPKRAWRGELLKRVKPLHDFALWLDVETAAQFADEDDINTLRHLATQFDSLHRRVVAAQSAPVVALRRIK